MAVTVLEPGADGIDGAGLRGLASLQPVADAGYQWVSLYLGGNYGVSKWNVEAAWAAGLPVMLNYERSATLALGGYEAGRQAALTAMEQAQALGFTGEAPLIFSLTDFGPNAGQIPTVIDAHRGLVETYTLGAGGAYGPYSVLSQLARLPWWPDDWPLWHWAGDGTAIYDWAWVKQWYGHHTGHDNSQIPVTIDENTLLKPMGFWSATSSQSDTPVARKVLMPSHVCFASAPDGTFVEVVECHDGNHRWREVGEIPGGAGSFYACHPNADGVNPIGQNELDTQGHYDAVADAAWLGQHLGVAGGGSGASAAQVVDELSRRLANG